MCCGAGPAQLRERQHVSSGFMGDLEALGPGVSLFVCEKNIKICSCVTLCISTEPDVFGGNVPNAGRPGPDTEQTAHYLGTLGEKR